MRVFLYLRPWFFSSPKTDVRILAGALWTVNIKNMKEAGGV
jgi:hypothetical protein